MMRWPTGGPGDRPLCIAHRGASAHAPENTLAAIVKAAELGADMVEVDLQASADGVLVVLHDAELSARTNGSGPVYARTVAELKQLDAGGGEQIPTAEEVLACCRDLGLGAYLELKIGYAAAEIVPLVRRFEMLERVIVASFSPDWVAEARACDPALRTSVLFGSTRVDPVALAAAAGAACVHPCWEHEDPEPHRLLTPEWLARVRAAGLGIVSWHEERLPELEALTRLGVDAICTNAPDLLRR